MESTIKSISGTLRPAKWHKTPGCKSVLWASVSASNVRSINGMKKAQKGRSQIPPLGYEKGSEAFECLFHEPLALFGGVGIEFVPFSLGTTG